MSEQNTALQDSLKALLNLAEFAGYSCVLCSLLGFFSRFDVIPFDLFCHFRVQYLCLLALLVVPSIVRKRWIAVAMLSTAMVLNFCEVVPIFVAEKPVGAPVNRTVLTLVDTNFNSRNTNFDLLQSLVDSSGADILCWQEFSPAAESWAKTHLPAFKYSKQIPRNDNFGIALFSKLPVTSFRVENFSDVPIESIVATVQAGGKPIQVISTHTYPPITGAALYTRDLQLKNLGIFVRNSGVPTILCGDLNATSWSSSFKDLINDSGLKDSRQGFGVQPSWPAGLGPMMIPIDHVLVNPQMQVLSRTIGSAVRSDHFPVIVKLSI
ncbi:MAG: endonuclease/exonuclease/phosphatase family protein [Cyanobacteria bacterium SZAS-4]|nr:endonuclease/exonuclease/phosphatase family protein [Cyanobacteria bacterium SZAS-4]